MSESTEEHTMLVPARAIRLIDMALGTVNDTVPYIDASVAWDLIHNNMELLTGDVLNVGVLTEQNQLMSLKQCRPTEGKLYIEGPIGLLRSSLLQARRIVATSAEVARLMHWNLVRGYDLN